MSRPLPLSDLHIMIGALETALKEQQKLVDVKFNALPKHKKDVVIRLRDEARDLKVSLTSPFISEADWKANLETRLQAKMKWASQILRQLKIVKEMRLKSKVFYLVTA
uniref:CHAD domain-containing protein n=1 Tax=Panagrellus redivivus TaxID=6233 RepID=A0A7E4UZE7_PANRE